MNSILNHFNLKSGKNVLFFRGAFLISILIIILLGFTLWAESFDLDRRFSAQFYSFDEDWHLAEFAPWSWFYDYGAIPGIIMSIISFFLWGIYRTHIKLSVLRPYLLICAFTPIVSSLLIVNVLLKDHTGRPRPREIIHFNGNWEYKPVLKLGIPGKGHSFPCGHCSIAFTLTSGIVFFRHSRKFAISSFTIGLAYGILMSIARIFQGGHFLSDAVWSLGVVFFTLLVFYYFIFKPPETEDNPILTFSKKQKWGLMGTTTLVLLFLVLFIYNLRPFYKNHSNTFEITSGIKRLEVYAPKNWNIRSPIFEDRTKGNYNLEIKGYAPPYTTHYLKFYTQIVGEIIKLRFKESVFGYQRNFHESLELRVPSRFEGDISTFKIYPDKKP